MVTRISFNPDKLFQMDFKAVEALSDAAAEYRAADADEPADPADHRRDRQRSGAAGAGGRGYRAPGGGSDDLLEASGVKPDQSATELPKRGGRPVGSKNRPKQIEAQVTTEPEEPGSGTGGAGPAGKPAANYEESDSELDGALTKLLGRKVQDMLK